jgi:ATP-dependent DNA ligase
MIRAIMASLRRKQAIEERKHALTNLLYREPDGIVVNRHYDGDGAIIYRQACALGCEGIVSKRRGSPYRSGRTDHWLPVIRRQSLGEFIGRTLAGAALRAPRGPRACAPRPQQDQA